MDSLKSLRKRLLNQEPYSHRLSKHDREVVSMLEKDEVGRLRSQLKKRRLDIDREIHWSSYRHVDTPIKPYFVAATRNREMVKLFLDNGVDVNQTTESGETALHFTAMFRGSDPQIVSILVDNGIDINARDRDRGYTALHCACEQRNHGVVRKLLDSADRTILDVNGNSALDLAKLSKPKCDQTIRLFEDKDKELILREEREILKSTNTRMQAIERHMQEQSLMQLQLQHSLSTLQVEFRRSQQSLNNSSCTPSRSASSNDVSRLVTNDTQRLSTSGVPHLQSHNTPPQDLTSLWNPQGLTTHVNNSIPFTQTTPATPIALQPGPGTNNPIMQYAVLYPLPNHQASQLQLGNATGTHTDHLNAPHASTPVSQRGPRGYASTNSLASSVSHMSLFLDHHRGSFTTDTSGFHDESYRDRRNSSLSVFSLGNRETHQDRPLSKDKYERVRSNLEQLAENMKPRPLLVKLFSGRVIEQRTYDELKDKQKHDQNMAILTEIILKGKESDFVKFVQALRDQNEYLAAMLDCEYADSCENSDSAKI